MRAKIVIIIFSLLALVAGLVVRFDDLRLWYDYQGQTFYQNKPLLTTFDGYYYLRLARDIQRDAYSHVDEYRHPPKPGERPWPAPLLSSVTARFSAIFGISLEWAGFVLPPLLGILLFFPVYGFGKEAAGRITGCIGGFLAILAPYYVYRSGMGWLDTDCLNVTFVYGLAYLSMLFGRCRTSNRYLFLVLAAAVAVLFWMWWHTTSTAVLIALLVPLSAAVVLDYRPSKKLDYAVSGVVLVTVVVLVALRWADAVDLFENVRGSIVARLHSMSKSSDGVLLPDALSTSEQVRPGFIYLANACSHYPFLFIIGSAGFIWLFVCRVRVMVYCLVPYLFGCLSFFYAERFIIFLSPLVALGSGFLLQGLWRLSVKGSEKIRSLCDGMKMNVSLAALYAGMGLLYVLAVGLPVHALLNRTIAMSKIEGKQAEGMDVIRGSTPEGSIVWTWWDLGYAVQYYADRRTLFDGSMHGGELSMHNAFPWASSDERLSANYINFYCKHGAAGIRGFVSPSQMSGAGAREFAMKILSVGPEEAQKLLKESMVLGIGRPGEVERWLEYFFPDDVGPVYLYIDSLALKTAYWWYWFGTWSPESGEGVRPLYDVFWGVKMEDGVIKGDRGLLFDSASGILSADKGKVKISGATIRFPKHIANKKYPGDGARFECRPENRFGVVMSPDIAESVFSRLFVRNETWADHYRLIKDDSPHYQVWEVKPDKYEN